MDRNRIATTVVFAAASALAAGAALATALPQEQSQGPVTFLSGGIGKDEALAMKHAEAKYPLSLVFVEKAKPRDEYLASVAVTIKDGKGNTELQATSEGPYLLAKLPDGKYTVTAEHDGKTERRHIVVASAKPKQVVFAW